MKNHSRVANLLAMICLLAGGAAWAEEEKPEGAEHTLSAEHQAMMEAWAKAGTPGDPHAWLAESAGTWNVQQTLWVEPGAEPMVAQGTAEREAILGGRVVREKFSSNFMGEPYQGVAHSGYDNVTDTYWLSWMDNMSTALYTGEGECNEGHSHCSFTLSGSDPMTGGEHTSRIEVVFEEGKEINTFYDTFDGEEYKTMELVYTRAAEE